MNADDIEKIQVRYDGWQNLVAGIGKIADKTRSTTYVAGCLLSDPTLGALYAGDGFGAAIVDIPADDMTREWITIGNDEGDKIKNELKKLHAESKFNLALKWARLYGGSGIVIGISGNGEINTPAVFGKSKKVMWFEIISRPQIYISASIINKDLTSDNYGKVEVYNAAVGVNFQNVNIHYTRFLEFKGKPLPYDLVVSDIDRMYWGMSALQTPWEYLKAYGAGNQAIENILLEFIIGKYSLDGLSEMLASGNEARIIKRVEVINYTKSVINAVLLGENEKYERDSASVTGLSDIIDRFQMNLSGVCRIPVTKLFRRSPAGMNATGDSDLTNYYDDIASEQENILQEPLQKLVNTIAVGLGMASSVETADFPITFNPLYQMTEKEQAEVEKTRADTDKIYMDNGVLDPAEVREIRFPELDVMETGKGEGDDLCR